MRLVLFDCDGTIADSFPIICRTMRLAFERHGLPAPEEPAIHEIIGLSLETATARLAPEASLAEAHELAEAYRTVFRELRNDAAFREPLFAGAEDMLRALNGRDDTLIGLVTGKSRRGVRLILDAHGLEPMFQTVRTADDCPSKPHPAMVLECCGEMGVDPAATLVVGDAIYDMQMAAAARAQGLGVSWGASSSAALVAAGAGAVAEDMGDLARRIDRWLAAPVALAS